MIFLACSNKIIDNDQKIYKLVINNVVYPVPPPPPPSTSTEDYQSIGANVIDSISKVPIKVAVYPYEIKFSLTKKSNQIQADSQVTYKESKTPVNFHKLNARESITLELLKDEEKNISKISERYDGILKVSDIKYNQENTKAIILVAFSRGKLSGSLMQFYLEKENDEWFIISSRTLLVS